MKVLMFPLVDAFKKQESGIKRVVEAYTKYLPKYDIEVVGPNSEFDMIVVHAGSSPLQDVDVAMLHGLYWTADYESEPWLWRGNEHVVRSIRHAKTITVPSNWVAETIQRDLRVNPHVLGHGIDIDQWSVSQENRGYVLWNKNRGGMDVCDPYPVAYLSKKFQSARFVTTFYTGNPGNNVQVTGLLPHDKMKIAISQCGVYLATTKETFGIGTLEAMASGKPILGFAHGGILDMVQHGVNGYLAEPGNYDDLARGLDYCFKNAAVLGANSRQLATGFTWDKAIGKVANVLELSAGEEPALVDVVIPVYNKEPDLVERAIDSALSQTMYLGEVIVVNDGSTLYDYSYLANRDDISYYAKPNGGVATARNYGIERGKSKYVLCLDSDDWIKPVFLEACVNDLEKDRSIGIAYTGLWYTKPDGEEGLSPWPGEFDYDLQLQRRNQIPTACVFRREMWKRLGGYKQRYAPTGAGSEDAEFWTRAGAYGWGAKKAANAGLFMYSWMSGIVTGNPHYREVDWLEMHPWVKDGQHPFASVATPKNKSHPVRQYDQPTVSVIIPVGPGHESALEMALDSLESQTLRRWEAIVVNDTGASLPKRLLDSYPYIKLHNTDGKLGAGAARNIGAKAARASLILFLDADDYLRPDALASMVGVWNDTGNGVYSDYVGRSNVDDVSKLAPDLRGRIISSENGETAIAHKALDYDCRRALKQPENPPYVWCNITTLIPKAWHNEIGGFDESMPSWEDVDYWWRMAWAGKCFTRVREQLLVYKFYSGTRRQVGLHMWDDLLKYMSKKKEGIEVMGCGCSQNSATPSVAPTQMIRSDGMIDEKLIDEDMILVKYLSPNKGQHAVIGRGPNKRRYGYRSGGETFLVHKEDITAQPHMYQVIERDVVSRSVPQEKVITHEPTPIVEPASIDPQQVSKGYDFQSLPGVTPAVAKNLIAAGFTGPDDLKEAGRDGLMKVNGIGSMKAQMILKFLSNEPD